jgi:SAM-dependent methyltransferase
MFMKTPALRTATPRVLRRKARSLLMVGRRRTAARGRSLTMWVIRGLRRAPVPEKLRLAVSTRVLRREVTVPVDSLLLGAQNARTFTADEFAAQADDLMWASTRVADGPHAQLLRQAERTGGVLSDEEILESPYGRMALTCIREQGRYFSATDPAGVVKIARSFLAGETAGDDDRPVLVAPIRGSDCYQVLDGHHRVAWAAVEGRPTIDVAVKRLSVTTPLQNLLVRMSWLDGARQLYQPLDAPELRRSWPIVRRCTDRRDKMVAFLDERGLLPPATTSYLDIACCYGWFVGEMATLGYRAEGMERDPLGRVIGQAAYGVDPASISVGDCESLLQHAGRQWDVVSCFSLLHHFVLGRGSISHEELLRRIDGVTGRVLFLDTGQEHEEWFRDSLAGWDTEKVRRTLAENTTFDEIVDLGPDEDAVPPHERNYGRHLFACIRTRVQATPA